MCSEMGPKWKNDNTSLICPLSKKKSNLHLTWPDKHRDIVRGLHLYFYGRRPTKIWGGGVKGVP